MKKTHLYSFLLATFLVIIFKSEPILALTKSSATNEERKQYRQIYKRQDGRVGDYYATSEEMNTKILPNTPRGNRKKVTKKQAQRLDNFEILSPEQNVNPYYKLMLRQRVMAPTMNNKKKEVPKEKVKEEKPPKEEVKDDTPKKEKKYNIDHNSAIPSKKNLYISAQGLYFLPQNTNILGFEKRPEDSTTYPSEIMYSNQYSYNSSYGGSLSLGTRNMSDKITRKEIEFGYLKLTGKNGDIITRAQNNPSGTNFSVTENLMDMSLLFGFVNLMKDVYINRILDFSYGGGAGFGHSTFDNDLVRSGYFVPIYNLTLEMKLKLSRNIDFFVSYRAMYMEGDFENNYPIVDSSSTLPDDRTLTANGTRMKESFFNSARIGLRYYFN